MILRGRRHRASSASASHFQPDTDLRLTHGANPVPPVLRRNAALTEVCTMDKRYGLELTNNSKASWAFSLPRSATCIGATEICKKVCYGNGVRYRTSGQKARRERNFRTVELLLERGGPELLAENLMALADTVRPSDWLAASITSTRTQTPWTLRIHDVGDYPEFRTIPCSKISEHKMVMVSRTDSPPWLQHAA